MQRIKHAALVNSTLWLEGTIFLFVIKSIFIKKFTHVHINLSLTPHRFAPDLLVVHWFLDKSHLTILL